MTDDEVSRYLHGLAAHVPHVEAPVNSVLIAARDAGRRRTRRRAVAVAVVAAASIAALAVTSTLVRSGIRTESPAPAAPTSTLSQDEDLTIPAGMRLVGANGVAIAVPDGWASQHFPMCGTPPAAYVSVGRDEAYSCPPLGSAVSGVVIETLMPKGSPAPTLRLSVHEPTPTPVTVHQERRIGRVLEGTFTATARGISFVVTIQTPPHGADSATALLKQIESSAILLPDGWTTVPGWPNRVQVHGNSSSFGPVPPRRYLRVLDKSGLRALLDAHLCPAHAPRCAERQYSVPAEGTVVRRGALVRVAVR